MPIVASLQAQVLAHSALTVSVQPPRAIHVEQSWALLVSLRPAPHASATKPQRISIPGVMSRRAVPSAHVSAPPASFPMTALPHHSAQSPIDWPSGPYSICERGGDGGSAKYAAHAALHMSPDLSQQSPPAQ